MKVTVVDYGSGNLRSVAKAVERAARDVGPGQLASRVDVCISSDPRDIAAADRVILPGVGAFGACVRGVAAIDGMREALETFAVNDARPFLGICVGMQLMADEGLEHGHHKGFGWIGGTVEALAPKALKVPHMGWNELAISRPHPVLSHALEAVPQEPKPHAYFVHSFAMTVTNKDHLVAATDYGGPVTALVARDNLIGTQFHPEKSQAFGLGLIAGFLKWTP